ncbi:MAG: beta-ketoacyl-ACP synthase III [Reinekea sp.]
MKDVYINSTGHYLPGPPIDNGQIENILGLVHGKPSKLKSRILRANGIKTRHYALNDRHETTVLNETMAVLCARDCIEKSAVDMRKVSMLACATSQGDMVLPGFASLVQAQLEIPQAEISTAHGICSSSLMAMKTAYLNLRCGEHDNALVIGSELSSRLFKASRYEAIEDASSIDFNAEFLRWMLSDGAGACLLENQPRKNSFRIDWITSYSHADAFPTCMSVGAPLDSHDPRTWQDYPTYAEAEKAGALLLRQDVRLLENVLKIGVDGFLRLIEEGKTHPDKIDHLLCHYSSDHFRSKIFDMLVQAGAAIPEERWYTNLYTRGNTGCASIFIMLDEFRRTQQFKPGDQILCMVPESGRFNVAYMKLTVMGD